MIQMSPPVKTIIEANSDSQDFDFTKLGVTFECSDILSIEDTKEKYQKLKERLEKLGPELKPNNSKAYLRIKYNRIKREGFTVQSITEIEDKVIISAYRRKNYSRLYIYDIYSSELEGVIILDNKAHVGGISYDHDRNVLYVTGSKGEINSYDYDVIRNMHKEKNYIINLSDNVERPVEEQLEIKINNNICVKKFDSDAEASTIYYYDNRLYVATFNPVGDGYLYSYKVDYDQDNKSITIIDEHTKKYKIGPRVQGIAITNINDKNYLFCSQSIGIANSSILAYEISEEKVEYIGKTYLKDYGLEGIAIDDDNYLVGIFEHNERPILVKKVETLLKEISNNPLDIIPGNELESLIGGLVYKLFE